MIFAILPVLVYEVFYSIMAISHMDGNWKVPMKYDWYGFMQGGLWSGIPSVIGMAILASLVAFLLLFFYRKRVAARKRNGGCSSK